MIRLTGRKSGTLCGMVVAWLLLQCIAAGGVSALSHRALLSQLERDDWQEYFSTPEETRILHDEGTFGVLVGILLNGGIDWRIRLRGIHLLGEIRSPEAAEVLTDLFYYGDRCPALEAAIATSLGNFRDNVHVVDALIDGAKDEEIQVREAAIRSLGKVGDKSALPVLIANVSDKSFAIRYSAVTALGRLGDKDGIAVLKRAAQEDPEKLVQEAARAALEDIR
jgi:hypothetical protein